MQSRFLSAFEALPSTLQTALAPLLDDPDFEARLSASQVAALQQQTQMDADTLALALLPLAAACAVATVSHFNVGAIARGVSGAWYFGANMEFVGAPLQQTVHAEQSAITHAWLCGEPQLESITVNYTPCGHCRQFMNELNSGTAIRISLPQRAVSTLADYLPDAFGPRDLDISTFLMDHVDHGYVAAGDELVQAAVAAANASHAPYSQSHAGVALLTVSGSIVTGRYAENAAFNPSFPPLQAALVRLNMQGGDVRQIKRAVLAEAENATLSQFAATQATLQTFGCSELLHVTLNKA
ncbi:cytidine deaminase [Enterobacteriaceae bacterium EKM102V]|uniref:Cytidine deaminase n=1 Tax=Pantoea anthophila TaxID=470931 RepID=A0ABY2ZEC4_9GAMM|nr:MULTISPECIES: cytidine deaminase [Pantoea]KAF6661100.1 cytidine deaminase [Enterobacteriaceae bacterium EKM102V]KAF6668390.1 cytidine deaminase [Pantoea sp. EKM103V]MEB5705451.1 cytidine deaminase [Pantoea anthophila]MEB6516321.1 cytidine deaminase [Pantoea anthophila]TPV32094.1 cytidine deaminase [Pantoea anthophila]